MTGSGHKRYIWNDDSNGEMPANEFSDEKGQNAEPTVEIIDFDETPFHDKRLTFENQLNRRD